MKKPRNFVTVIIKKRRKLGIQEPSALPEGIEKKELPTMFADGYRAQKVRGKAKGYMESWKP